MKKLIVIIVLLFSIAPIESTLAQSPPVSVYQYNVTLINGVDTFSLNSWVGKKILFVNTASQSGYANQFSLLEQLYQQFKDSGLVVLACPSNSLGFEPLVGLPLQEYHSANFQTTFKISNRIQVKGTGTHSIFQWLTQKSMNGVADVQLRSDFSKFLVDSQGKLVAYFDGQISPLDERVLHAIRGH